MDSLGELTNLIDEVKEQLGDDRYLKIMDLMKKIHEHVLSEQLFEHISNKYQCLEHGVFCECSADERVGMMMNDIQDVPKYLKIIARQTADHYGIELI